MRKVGKFCLVEGVGADLRKVRKICETSFRYWYDNGVVARGGAGWGGVADVADVADVAGGVG